MTITRRHISIALIALAFIGSFGHVAHAIEITDILGLGGIQSVFTEIVAQAVNMALMMMSWILAIAGLMLNVAMNITLNIKAFVDATPAIFTVWRSIRDISGMFIIFMLLFAGIRMILAPINVPAANMGQLIKTIVVAGILINFSFFIAGLGIDVSNIVSMQLYNTIAPAQKLDSTSMLSVEGIKNAFKQGGISNIFMSSLKISSLYDPKTLSLTDVGKSVAANSTTGFSPSLKIIIIGVIAFMIMLAATISFALAALAFTVRFVILLFLLAFSPIWFASFALPQLDEYAKKWTKIYKGQMLFMPVYLLLMYFAMSVLVSNNMVSGGFASNLSNRDDWYSNILILSVNAVLVIFMLNAPLVAAMSIMGSTPKWAENLGAGALWKKVGGWARSGTVGTAGTVGGIAARHTIGAGAMALNKKLGNTKFFGDSVIGRDLVAKTVGAVAKNKFGTARSAEDYAKASGEAKRQGESILRSEDFQTAFKNSTKGIPPVVGKTIKDTFSKLNEKERLSLGVDALINPEVIKNISSSNFEAIKKSDDFSDDEKVKINQAREKVFIESAQNGKDKDVEQMLKNMNDDQKKSLGDARSKALVAAINGAHFDTVKQLLSDMDGKELLKIENGKPGTINNTLVVKHLNSGQLKKLSEEGLDSKTKKDIGDQILLAGIMGSPHKAAPFINKNKAEWTT